MGLCVFLFDADVATLQGADASHDENGCQLSKRNSPRGRHWLDVYDRFVLPASLVANNAGIEVRCPHHYRLLTPMSILILPVTDFLQQIV